MSNEKCLFDDDDAKCLYEKKKPIMFCIWDEMNTNQQKISHRRKKSRGIKK